MTLENTIGMHKSQLDTPCLVIDIDTLKANLKLMADYATAHSKQLRPHAKTHKCSNLAKLQLKYGAIGICAAKVSEATILAANGIQSILITSPVTTEAKIEKLLSIRRKTSQLMVVVDNLTNAKRLSDTFNANNSTLDVLVDIDPEMGRTGVPYEQAFDFSRALSKLPSLNFKGIQCYSGLTQHIDSFDDRQQDSLSKMGKAETIVKELNESGLHCDIFSGTGTGTYNIDIDIPLLTDLQVGSYAVMDAEYTVIGSKEKSHIFDTFQPALSILSSVISVNQNEFVTIDAGLKAVYLNNSAPFIIKPTDTSWTYNWFGDEHGKLMLNGDRKPELGSLIELSTSHCDPTINLYDNFFITKDDIVTEIWPIDLRGKSQ